MKPILIRIVLIVLATTIGAVLTAAAMASPVAILVDASGTSNPLPCRVEARSRIAELLSVAPAGTPFEIIAFNRQPALVYSGVVSAHDVLAALTAMDGVKHSGATDLGSALAYAQQQALLVHGSNTAVISDFFIDAPARSKWAGVPLAQLLQTAQLQGASHILLVPICSFNKVALQQPMPGVAVLGSSMTPARWIQSLTPPPQPPPPQPPVTFWRRGAFQCAAGLALLLVLSSIAQLHRQREKERIQKEIDEVTAAALSNEIDVPASPGEPTQEPPRPRPLRRVFVAMIQQDGRVAVVDTDHVLVGASPLATMYIEGAITTLKLSKIIEGAFCEIKNAGARAVYIGSKRLEPNASVRLSADNTAECRLTPTSTVCIYATIEELDHDLA